MSKLYSEMFISTCNDTLGSLGLEADILKIQRSLDSLVIADISQEDFRSTGKEVLNKLINAIKKIWEMILNGIDKIKDFFTSTGDKVIKKFNKANKMFRNNRKSDTLKIPKALVAEYLPVYTYLNNIKKVETLADYNVMICNLLVDKNLDIIDTVIADVKNGNLEKLKTADFMSLSRSRLFLTRKFCMTDNKGRRIGLIAPKYYYYDSDEEGKLTFKREDIDKPGGNNLEGESTLDYREVFMSGDVLATTIKNYSISSKDFRKRYNNVVDILNSLEDTKTVNLVKNIVDETKAILLDLNYNSKKANIEILNAFSDLVIHAVEKYNVTTDPDNREYYQTIK